MDLSLVIPARNEGANVARLIEEIAAALAPKFSYEVIVVDDGSTDDTAARVSAAAAGGAAVRLIRHARSYGQSAALRSGILAAQAPRIATLDGDGQNDPADIPRLCAAGDALERSTALWLINGHRQKRQDSASKRWASRIANRVRARLLKDATPDSGCGLKLFPRALYLALPYFDHMHRFMPALAQREGAVVRSVPVNHRYRWAGESNYTNWHRLWVGVVDLFGVLWLIRRAQLPIETIEPQRPPAP